MVLQYTKIDIMFDYYNIIHNITLMKIQVL